MANPFETTPPNVLQSLMQFDQGYKGMRGIMNQRDQQDARRAAQQALLTGGDTKSALARLIGAGDIQGANAIATYGNSDRDFQFRQQEAQRAQGNADRTFKMQEQQLKEKPQYMQVDDGNGGKALVRIDPLGGAVTAVNPQGMDTTPANPFSMGKMNESQSKDALYASRMFNAEKIFRDPSVVSAGQSLIDRGASKIPGVGNFLVSDKYQQFDQAKRDFINATLRRESGAVINPSEFENADKQYFPLPGDSPTVLAQKRKNREEAIRGIAAGAGPSFRPQSVFGANGDIIDNPAPARGRGKPSQATAAPPPAAVNALRQNPALREQFDAKYGPGASAQVLAQ